MEVVNAVAHVECFKGMFDKSCAEYLSNTIAAMAAIASMAQSVLYTSY